MEQEQQQQQQQQQQQMNSGLTRYRSAPSSYFADLISSSNLYGAGEVSDQFINPGASSPDSDKVFSRFMSSCGAQESNENSFVNEAVQAQFMVPMKHEADVIHPQQHQNQTVYQTQVQSGHKPVGHKPGIDTSFNVGSSMGMDNLPQMKMVGGSNSNLRRQSSSPAGLFAQVNVDTADYAVMRGMGKSGTRNHGEASYLSGSRLNNQMDFPPGPPSSSGMISHVFKAEAKSFGADNLESGSYGESGTNDGSYSFRNTSWDDSALLPDNFLAGLAENDRNAFSNINSSQNQIGEGGNRPSTVLAHHLSLPTSSSELSAMEKLLQFPDFVPLRSRAKRGCATHPRSIAERVRRTKISERMRKLQELVPNMDKQTNTSDMLDLAVDYIKDLQKEVKTLSDVRAKCTCSNNQ